MKIYEKISILKKTIKEIKNISQYSDKDSEIKISALNKEILRLKEGISENVEELEKILEEINAKT